MFSRSSDEKELKELIESLVNDLKNPDPKIRENAAHKFSNESNASSFDIDGNSIYKDRIDKFNQLTCEIAMNSIIEGLKDEDRLVKIPLIWCLGRLNDERAVKPLIETLNDKISGVRGASATNLVQLKNLSFKPLISALNSESTNIRRGAAFALGEIGKTEAFDPLIKSLKDPDWNVRFKAIEALGKIGDEKALEPISECLEDKSANVRRKASEIIGILGIGEKLPTAEEREEEAKRQREESINQLRTNLKSGNL